MPVFAIATLCPAVLIACAALFGGAWVWASLGYMTVLVFALDRLVAAEAQNADPEAEFPAADTLLKALGLLHFVLIAVLFWVISGATSLATSEAIVVCVAASLVFGQISHPVAHELIHKRSDWMMFLGRAIYTSLLIGHHASAHLRIHHVHVGSDKDPASPRLGEGFYRYAIRATGESFVVAFRDETKRWRGSIIRHPYMLYVGGGAGIVGASLLVGGLSGLMIFCAVAFYAQIQILMSDYVQHYGLRRQEMADGQLEPVGPQHSWNAPHWFSSALMLNATRHSHHHVSPLVPYPALQLNRETMPMLPYPLPIMGAMAAVPTLWRAKMDHRARKWQARQWHADNAKRPHSDDLDQQSSVTAKERAGAQKKALAALRHVRSQPLSRLSVSSMPRSDPRSGANDDERGGV